MLSFAEYNDIGCISVQYCCNDFLDIISVGSISYLFWIYLFDSTLQS